MGKVAAQSTSQAKIIWADRAQKDLQEIVQFTRERSLAAARQLAVQIREKVTRLELFPNSGRSLPEFSNFPYREILVSHYRVIYIYKKETVHILTVRHGKRLLHKKDLPTS